MPDYRRDRVIILLGLPFWVPMAIVGCLMLSIACFACAALRLREPKLESRGWHPWFAWWPVRINSVSLWLKRLERKRLAGAWSYRDPASTE